MVGDCPDSSPLRIRYEERALFPRHSFAEMKRMHGQKPLRSPGAWHEYLSAAWLLARCPHVHISRASSGEEAAGRPRTPATCFRFGKFLLATVPLSWCALGAILAPGVSFLLVSHLHGRISKRPALEGTRISEVAL